MASKKIFIAGDSHVYAIKSALSDKGFVRPGFEFEAVRVKADKGGGKVLGEADMVDVEASAKAGSEYDAVVLTLRGNQYNTMALMKHPRPFDVMIEGFPDLPADAYDELIPYATAFAYMSDSLRRGYGKLISRVVVGRTKPVLCLSVPSPKDDEAHILKGAETYFASAGISTIGVSPAPLRLKLWHLQTEVLRQYCGELGVPFLDNPPNSRTADGYLKREFYAKDATHANAAYGALVLDQIVGALSSVHQTGEVA